MHLLGYRKLAMQIPHDVKYTDCTSGMIFLIIYAILSHAKGSEYYHFDPSVNK